MTADLGASDEPRSEESGALVEGGQADGSTLWEIRRLTGMTRGQVAKAGGMTRYRVAKIEHAEDIAVSALHAYAKALGGRLELKMEFPNRPTVLLQRKRRRWVVSTKPDDPAIRRPNQS